MKIHELLVQESVPQDVVLKTTESVTENMDNVIKPLANKFHDVVNPVVNKIQDTVKPIAKKFHDIVSPYVEPDAKTTVTDKDSYPSNFQFVNDRDKERMSSLDPRFKTALYQAAKDSGLPFNITSSHRSQEEQDDLYRRWQRGEPGIYKPSKNVGSHGGFAVDMSKQDVANLHKWLQKNDPDGSKYGLQTGLEFGDPVHVQLRNFKNLK
jgi:hypothetical protein